MKANTKGLQGMIGRKMFGKKKPKALKKKAVKGKFFDIDSEDRR